jgi:hypothetical protein
VLRRVLAAVNDTSPPVADKPDDPQRVRRRRRRYLPHTRRRHRRPRCIRRAMAPRHRLQALRAGRQVSPSYRPSDDADSRRCATLVVALVTRCSAPRWTSPHCPSSLRPGGLNHGHWPPRAAPPELPRPSRTRLFPRRPRPFPMHRRELDRLQLDDAQRVRRRCLRYTRRPLVSPFTTYRSNDDDADNHLRLSTVAIGSTMHAPALSVLAPPRCRHVPARCRHVLARS